MAKFHELSTAQLRLALQLREQIESLQQKLQSILGGSESASAPGFTAKKRAGRPAGKRTMSAEARAKIAAAQKARWAKVKGPSTKSADKAKPAATVKKKGGLTTAGRAKLAAAMKARWEAKKKGGSAPNAPAK